MFRTIKAVINSADILEKYSKNNIQTKIIDAVGEWNIYEKRNRYIDHGKLNFTNIYQKGVF